MLSKCFPITHATDWPIVSASMTILFNQSFNLYLGFSFLFFRFYSFSQLKKANKLQYCTNHVENLSHLGTAFLHCKSSDPLLLQ